MRLRAGLIALVLSLATCRIAGAEDVALTFDDLPALSLSGDTAYWQTTTRALLAGLKRDRIPAIGFVTEQKLETDRAARVDLLRAWLDAGMDLGNHGYSHLSLSRTPVNAYIADVARGETVTRWLLAERGRTPRWYRHPYLETGKTAEDRRTSEAWLTAHGYRVAPVSIENSDWMFAYPYDEAVMHKDQAAEKRIRKEYLDYTAAVVPWYRKAATSLFGRPPSLVFLLHASRLNADTIGQLDAILKRNHLRPVTLDRAMADPAYATVDSYIGTDGDEWVTRWSMALHKSLDWSTFPQPPKDIADAETRLDTNP
ncbi:MAG TPA: polysaccharide deacetylase family protein [Caulobacteraceae bacterium]|jgi:peptidoglycan/xylan/chitin deacetylase (PgdA/CDA1 family)